MIPLLLALLAQAVPFPGPVNSVGSSGTWTLKHHNTNFSCAGGTACAVTLTATTAGSVLVAFSVTGSDHTISSGSGAGGTWTLCAASACHATTGGNHVDGVYNLSPTAGSTTATININTTESSFYGVWIDEYNWSGSTRTFDAGSSVTRTTCTSCTAVSLTISGTNDAIAQLPACDNTVSAPSAGWSLSADGLIFDMGASVGTAPTFTQTPTGVCAISAIAIKGS